MRQALATTYRTILASIFLGKDRKPRKRGLAGSGKFVRQRRRRLAFLEALEHRRVLATLVSWDFTGQSNVSTSTAQVVDSNLDVGGELTRGPGAPASAGNNSFRTTGFQNDGISTANTDYFQTTLSASEGNLLSLSFIDARFAGTATYAASPGVQHQFAYSLDGTTFTLIGSPTITVGTPAAILGLDLTGVSALQNIPDTTTVTFRYYASGQTSTGGWGFNSSPAGTVGLLFDGTVAPASDTTPPTVVSFDDGDDDNIIVVNETLVYTITFSEPIKASTVNEDDFDNAGTSDITIGVITQVSPAVFTVEVTPTNAGTIQLRIPGTATIEDLAGNLLEVPVIDPQVITVTETDITPPTIVSIVNDDSDDIIRLTDTLTYTVTFSEAIDEASISVDDFENAGTASVTIGAITAVLPGVFTIPMTPLSEGTIQLRIPETASILDLAGNALVVDPPILDSTIVIVDGTAPTLATIENDIDGGPSFVNLPITFTLTFSEALDAASVTVADFDNAGSASVSISSIAQTEPEVFTIVVTPTSSGTVQLRIPMGATITDVAGNALDVSEPIVDETIITINDVTSLSVGDVSIVGFRSDAPDGVAFATWVDLLPGTAISFWDSGYIGGGDGSGEGAGGGTWRVTEDFATWTNSTGATIVAGTVIVLDFPDSPAAPSADLGTVVGSLNGLSAAGDQIFVGQGQFSPGGNPSIFDGNLVFGFDYNGSAGWDEAATNANTSRLPGVLDVPGGNLAIDHIDNGQFTASRLVSSFAIAKIAVLDPANWTFEDVGEDLGALDSTDFTIADEVIITLDTEDTGSVTLQGGWGSSTSVPGFVGASYSFTSPGSNSTATFTPTLPIAGQYEVFVNYSAHPNRASNVALTVLHNEGQFATTIDQRTGGGVFSSVGTFNFDAGMIDRVILSAAGTDGFVTADAVRFVRVGDLTAPPTATLASPADNQSLTAADLNSQGYIEIQFSPALTIDPASIIDAAPEFTLSGPGVNDVEVDGAAADLGNGLFRYTFSGTFVPGEVFVDFVAGSFEDSAQPGLLNLATRQSFTLTDGAVRITLDNTDAIQVNGWTSSGAVPGFIGPDYLFSFAGGAGRLIYTPNIIEEGAYEVFVNYTDGPSRASNAVYEVVSQGGTTLVRVDQRTGGGTFQSIGTFNFLAGTGGSVTLAVADADGVVVGDAVQFVRVGNLTGAPTAMLANPVAGASIVVTVINGNSYIDVTFADTSGAGLDLATITDSEPEFLLSGPGAAGVTVDGVPTLVSGTTYRYATAGSFTPGAVDAVFGAGTFADLDGNLNLETIASFEVTEDVLEEVIVDNEGAGFAVSDPAQFLTSSAVGGFIGTNYRAAPTGSTATATWTPTLNTDGNYEVYVRYTSHPLRATNATYVVTHDGGTTNVQVDQTTGGGTWVLLGTYALTNGASSVQLLTAGANQFVVADAMRFVRV